MSHHVEPMDIDGDFDNKENSLRHNNVLPFTEKGYEELDVSELNMKLRYSVTPASSPMSKSYTTNCFEDRSLESGDDCLNITINENVNLTRSLNSSITKNDNIVKSLKTLPLKTISTDQLADSNRNNSVFRLLESMTSIDNGNVTVTIDSPSDIDENLSVPSSSSSALQTPEATTPTKDIPPKDGGSPIMRGLKSVFSMFRSSQSPIPPADSTNVNSNILSPVDEQGPIQGASTPVAAHRKKEMSPTKMNNSQKDNSIVFNEDLEKELQWKDETTIIFNQERIPIHKLMFQQKHGAKQLNTLKPELNSSVEYMDISNNSIGETTFTDVLAMNKQVDSSTALAGESDSEFVDCETTFTKSDSSVIEDADNTLKVDISQELNLTQIIESNRDNGSRLKQIVLDTTQDILNATLSVRPEDLISEIVDHTDEVISAVEILQDVNKHSISQFDNIMNESTVLETPNGHSNNYKTLPITSDSVPADQPFDAITADVSFQDKQLNVSETTKNSQTLTEEQASESLNITVLEDTITQDNSFDVTVTSIAEHVDDNLDIEQHQSKLICASNTTELPLTSSLMATSVPPSIDEPLKSISTSVNELPVNIPLPDEDDLDKDFPIPVNISNIPVNLPLDLVDDINLKSEIPSDKTSNKDEALMIDVKGPPSAAIFTDNNSICSQITILDSHQTNSDCSENIEVFELAKAPETLQKVPEATSYLDSVLIDGVMNETEGKLENGVIIATDRRISRNMKLDANAVLETVLPTDDCKPLPDIVNQTITMVNASNIELPVSRSAVSDIDAISENIDNISREIINLEIKPQILEETEKQNLCKKILTEINENGEELAISEAEKHVTANLAEETIITCANNDNNLEIIPQILEETEKQNSCKNLIIENSENRKELAISEAEKQGTTNAAEDAIITHTPNDNNLEIKPQILEETEKQNSCINLLNENNEELAISEAEKLMNTNLAEETIITYTPNDNNFEIKPQILEETEKHNSCKTLPVETNKNNEGLPISEADKYMTTNLNEETFITNSPYDNFAKNESGTVPIEFEKVQIMSDNNTQTVIEDVTPHLEVPGEIAMSTNTAEIEAKGRLSSNNSTFAVLAEESKSNLSTEVGNIVDKLDITPPNSPPITSKGYNFNFDDMDYNPFVTNTSIRMSPPFESPKNLTQVMVQNKSAKKSISKKDSRRKTQCDGKTSTTSKTNLNSTFVSAINNNTYDTCDDKFDTIPVKENLNKIDQSDTIGLNPNNITIDQNSTNNVPPKTEEMKLDIVINHELKSNEIRQNTSPESQELSFESNMQELNSNLPPEESTYCTASVTHKNVFNLPEIHDINFNPFATKSKMCQSPLLSSMTDINCFPITSEAITQTQTEECKTVSLENKINNEVMEKDTEGNVNFTKASSTDNINESSEIHTEDEDTVEGPFFEADALNPDDKMSDFEGDNIDMMQFNELPTQNNEENADNGEMFIDAEAFEFLLNQNQANTIVDSGKESLFLKFDPLFAKRMSAITSDGVVASLAKVQKRHSTPTKIDQSMPNVDIPFAGSSNVNLSRDVDVTSSEDSNDDINITISKPTMVVPPAVNPVTPRNKSMSPNKPNRRSITFTSPAMAVIDRLLSLSGNHSLLYDTTVTQVSREQHEADIALSQLRELLAEKEINVYNLRSESNELRDRLNTLESQVKSLENESQTRLKKINELNETVAEKTKINRSMAAVVEEYERTIASLIAETAQDKKRHAEERLALISERDEQTAHLASMEVSFSDLHSKYEKSKQIILNCKANEETYKKSIKEFEENFTKMQNNYELLKQHATSKLNHANQEMEKINRAHEAEVLKLNAMMKRKELHITSLEESLIQKTKANEELTAICDELINKVG